MMDESGQVSTIVLSKALNVRQRLAELRQWQEVWQEENARIRERLHQLPDDPVNVQLGVQLRNLRKQLQLLLLRSPLEIDPQIIKREGYGVIEHCLAEQFAELTREEKQLWLTNFLFLMTPVLRELSDKIVRMRQRRAFGQQRNCLVGGLSGMGKTTYLEWYAACYRARVEPTRNYVPVVMVDAPVGDKGPRPLLRKLVAACGRTYTLRDSEDELLDKIELYFDQCGVELLIVDEINHVRQEKLRRRFLELSNRIYRGTTGTEVALVLRNLCERLGLWERPEQLRIIAASASLNNDPSGTAYAAQFFGVPAATFEIISDQRDLPSAAPGDLSPFAPAFASYLQSNDDAALVQSLGQPSLSAGPILRPALESIAADASLLDASKDPKDGQRKAQSFTTLAQRVFKQVNDAAEQHQALGGLLRALGGAEDEKKEMLLPVRIHYFFRTIQGLWACTNPACDQVDQAYQDPDRPIGKLYFAPRIQCECGGRVVDVLYCQTCGELYLGGYKGIIDDNLWAIVPDQPNLQDLPDKAIRQRTHANYTVYWPSKDSPVEGTESWGRTNKTDTQRHDQFRLRFTHAYLDPMTGTISRADPGDEWTGWLYLADTKTGTDRELLKQLPAFPIYCPHCGDDWEGDKSLPVVSSDRTRSPIRTMRTGFEKINQVLGDSLLRQLPDSSRKLVVFSDSRQDAAKLSAGLEKNHFTDAIRQIVVHAASKLQAQPQLYLKYARQEDLTEEEEEAALQYERLFPKDADVIRRSIRRNASDDDKAKAQLVLAVADGPVALGVLRGEVERELMALGMNPAGPDPEFQSYHDGKQALSWIELVAWEGQDGPLWKQPGERSPVGDQHLQRISSRALQEVIYMLFAHQRRDIESLGLGWVSFDPEIDVRSKANGIAVDRLHQVCDATIRILADHGRTPKPPPYKNPVPYDHVPGYLRKYWATAAERIGVEADALSDAVQRVLGDSAKGCMADFILDPSRLFLHIRAGNKEAWVCPRCRQPHLHPAARTCTDTSCLEQLHATPQLIRAEDRPADYYAFLASADAGNPFRLNCQELTGQTNRDDSQKRQRLFQDVVLQDRNEIPLVDIVDVLSVTTTMEAGVDIGPLLAIMLSNMPPMRFNYQQRVGRAGRRGKGLSIALTVCRGSSHDDFYFQHPERITSDPPPQPYLDLRRDEIIRRVLAAEGLRRAFRACNISLGDDENMELGNNVHGQFGRVADWEKWEPGIRAWLASNEAVVAEILDALLREAPAEIQSLRTDLITAISKNLCDVIQEAVDDSRLTQDDLSERLAHKGWLPMFGFPTNVRLLYHDQPYVRRWPPERGVVDRDLSIAISQFAPGSETVKDKAVYTAVGVVQYEKKGPELITVDDPLGPAKLVGMCKQCQALDDAPDPAASSCPVCGNPDDFRLVDLSQPLGFCTAYGEERAFNGQFEWTPRATRARMPIPKDEPPWRVATNGAYRIHATSDLIYSINDNNGNDFLFQRQKGSNAWFVQEALPQQPKRRYELEDPINRRALVAISDTDVLLVGLQPDQIMAGIDLNPARLPQRAAWYSFGFMLRDTAARMLDIDRQELQVGLRPRQRGQVPDAEVFLSDTLENGAGYATHLGRDEVFAELLQRCVSERTRLENHGVDNAICDSACYDCLRDFSNLPYHGLLDWRLALDMARLARGERIQLDGYWQPLVQQLVAKFADTFNWSQEQFGPLSGLVRDDIALIVAHPLWNTRVNFMPDDLAEAVVEAEALGFRQAGTPCWQVIDLFEVARRPAWYDTQLHDDGAA